MSAAEEERAQALAWALSVSDGVGDLPASRDDPEPVVDPYVEAIVEAVKAQVLTDAAPAPAPRAASPTHPPLSTDHTAGQLGGHGGGVLRGATDVTAAREAMVARVNARRARG